MKAAILSDVHGNLDALRAVLAQVREWRADAVYSLGDTVGYGPYPRECISLLRSEAGLNILGNHDAAVVERTPVDYFNSNARAAVEWTRGVLSEDEKTYLYSLPYTEQADGLFLVHASPLEPAAWHYIAGIATAAANFTTFTEPVCLVGHTHVPFVMELAENGAVRRLSTETVELREGRRYLVNAGSVGQPRDGDPRAAFVLLDTAERILQVRRTAYPVRETQEAMRREGLPDFLVERLGAGC